MNATATSPFPNLKKIRPLFAIHVEWDGEWMLYKPYWNIGSAKNALLNAKNNIGKVQRGNPFVVGGTADNAKTYVDVKVRIVRVDYDGSPPVVVWEDMLSNAQRGNW